MVPQTISTAVLIAKLMAVKGARFLTITTETEPKMRKTNNPYFGNVVKRSTANVTMNFSYENAVNNQRVREGNGQDFVAQPRKWGEKIPGTCFVTHNNQMYMEVKYNAAPSNIEYFLKSTGETIAKDMLTTWLQESNSNAEHQGVEKEIVLRDVKLVNVKELKMNGEHYIVK